MDYFTAVQKGRRRVNAAIGILQDIAGPCYPMLFLKMGLTDWTPVGEEMLQKVIPGKNATAALAICDADGNCKTMSGWVSAEKAEDFARTLERKGIPQFPGEVKLPI